MMDVLPRQLASPRWLAQFWPPNPAAYLRDERFDDYVEPVKVQEDWRCQHDPACYNIAAHRVKQARERGEL